jgi:AraC-like DNA-binding protein
MCLLRRHGMAKPSFTGRSPSVAKAIQCLDSAPEARVSLAELAALSGVSRFQLLRGFAREAGITPHAYLVQRRVCLVQRLLADGQTPAQAAIQVGFADQSHMTRAFVRQLGITPAAIAQPLPDPPGARNFVQDAAAIAVRFMNGMAGWEAEFA